MQCQYSNNCPTSTTENHAAAWPQRAGKTAYQTVNYNHVSLVLSAVCNNMMTRILQFLLKILKGFRNLRKSIETSGDISVL